MQALLSENLLLTRSLSLRLSLSRSLTSPLSVSVVRLPPSSQQLNRHPISPEACQDAALLNASDAIVEAACSLSLSLSLLPVRPLQQSRL